MNAVEISDAVADLFRQEFDPDEFPYSFLEAFGNKDTTIKRLRKGDSNFSDVPRGLLQRNHIHLAVCDPGTVSATLRALRESPRTTTHRAKFILATDGEWLEAEELVSGEPLALPYAELPTRFSLFLPLAGISTVKEIKENPIDIRATGRLNKLYVELLRENPDWATDARRPDMNHFMARLIFCFFAEDTGIFHGTGLFTGTIDQMTDSTGANTASVISRVFEAMNLRLNDPKRHDLPAWAEQFPYVNGGLFSGSTDVPMFTRIARSYLVRAGELDWRQINPDIFGSMIQAVADDSERGELGMHYTSVPNILKVLNPLFLDELRAQLDAAGTNPRMLLNLRKRIARIRVFDPACGSGNFLVIAYKEMRKIEATINARRNEPALASEIPLTNFRGIEIRDFAAEIARLALIIAEYQCDVQYRGEKLALAEFLPLNKMNWIVCGNALRLDWLQVCPPTGTGVKVASTDLFGTPLDQAEIDFTNEGGETYICGNPPYVGDKKQSKEQKLEMCEVFEKHTKSWKSLDYVAAWFMKAALYGSRSLMQCAFVTTNSVNQGQQAPVLWPLIFESGHHIKFAHPSFKWSNLASNNAGVTVAIIGISSQSERPRILYSTDDQGKSLARVVANINAYLIGGPNVRVAPRPSPISKIAQMLLGNFAKDAGHLICDYSEVAGFDEVAKRFLRPMFGGHEFIQGSSRYCFWVPDSRLDEAKQSPVLRERFTNVTKARLASPKKATREWNTNPHRFVEIRSPNYVDALVIPIVSSENREYLPVGYLPRLSIVNYAFGMYDAPLWNMALIASRLHLVWIATVCGKLETRYRYSNTLGWNTFPVPTLTDSNKRDLTRCAEDILLAREAHFPATIADLYDPENMQDDLRRAHERNDEVLERIYIGRRFKNDTERLEKLFELYTKMTESQTRVQPKKKKTGG